MFAIYELLLPAVFSEYYKAIVIGAAPADYLSAVLTGVGDGDSPGTVTMTAGTLSVTAHQDPGTDVLPNTDPAWGVVASDSLNNPSGLGLTYPFTVSMRFVGGAWYYYMAPF